MQRSGHRWTDEQVEQVVGNLLRIGVAIAAVFVLAGGVSYLTRSGGELPNYAVFRGEPCDLRSVSGIVHDVLSLNTRGLIQFGILLLIATPVARVAFSIAAFALEGDRTYLIVTLIVFAVLVYSLIGGGL